MAGGSIRHGTIERMVYTCYEMVRDCRAGTAEGWSFFAANYVPVMRRLIAHYAPERAADRGLEERLLVAIRQPEAGLFQSLEPAPERYFLAGLRQMVLGSLEAPDPEMVLDLATAAEALAPLTVTEKLAAWLETMRYTPQQTAAMLRVSAAMVEKVRERAAELIRGKVDQWRRTILAENGMALGRAASEAGGKDCYPSKAFLDILDGRTTWAVRERTDQHVTGCLHCVDHWCRMVETTELPRGVKPLAEAEVAGLKKLLGVAEKKKRFWQ